jgi:hypothetical protein
MGVALDEQEIWNHSTGPRELLFVLAIRSVSRRKLRLFGCAAARQVFPLLSESSRAAVEVAELYADGFATDRQLAAARRTALQGALGQEWTVFRRIWNGEECRWATWNRQLGTAAWATLTKQEPMGRHEWCEGDSPRNEALLLHDICGDPFHPFTIDVSWLTTIVVGMAQAIYDDRAFERLPMLADALEEAGCANADLLGHCRGSGPHVRGCWVVDLLLGKE